MKKIMAVFDADPIYADKLAEYVNRRDRTPFTAVAFTNLDCLKEYASKQQIELLLAGNGIRPEISEEISAHQIVWLGGEQEVDVQMLREPLVYKYQSADNIVRDVMTCCQLLMKQCSYVQTETGCEVIGIYSPVNRCGKTGLGLTMGRILAKEKKVLFVSLEENSGFTVLFGREHRHSLSDMIYYFDQNEGSCPHLSTCVYNLDELDYIPPVTYAEDLGQLSREMFRRMLEQVEACGGYDVVVIDFGQYGKGIEQLFSICSKLYVPILDDCVSQAKLEEWKRYLEYSGKGNLWEQIQMIKLPAPGTKQGGSYLDELLWGEVGDYIRLLLKGEEMLWKQ